MTDKTASELAAERLGIGLDPRTEVLADLETLLDRDVWSDDDRKAALAAVARAKRLGDEPPTERSDEEPAERSASEIAAERYANRQTRRRGGRGWS